MTTPQFAYAMSRNPRRYVGGKVDRLEDKSDPTVQDRHVWFRQFDSQWEPKEADRFIYECNTGWNGFHLILTNLYFRVQYEHKELILAQQLLWIWAELIWQKFDNQARGKHPIWPSPDAADQLLVGAWNEIEWYMKNVQLNQSLEVPRGHFWNLRFLEVITEDRKPRLHEIEQVLEASKYVFYMREISAR